MSVSAKNWVVGKVGAVIEEVIRAGDQIAHQYIRDSVGVGRSATVVAGEGNEASVGADRSRREPTPPHARKGRSCGMAPRNQTGRTGIDIAHKHIGGAV